MSELKSELDRRILAAVAAGQHQGPQPQQWNPVVGFLLPLYREIIAAMIAESGLDATEGALAYNARWAWAQVLASFRQLGFEYVHPLGWKLVDNESAVNQAAKEAR